MSPHLKIIRQRNISYAITHRRKTIRSIFSPAQVMNTLYALLKFGKLLVMGFSTTACIAIRFLRPLRRIRLKSLILLAFVNLTQALKIPVLVSLMHARNTIQRIVKGFVLGSSYMKNIRRTLAKLKTPRKETFRPQAIRRRKRRKCPSLKRNPRKYRKQKRNTIRQKITALRVKLPTLLPTTRTRLLPKRKKT